MRGSIEIGLPSALRRCTDTDGRSEEDVEDDDDDNDGCAAAAEADDHGGDGGGGGLHRISLIRSASIALNGTRGSIQLT